MNNKKILSLSIMKYFHRSYFKNTISTINEAVSGSDQDFTKGNLGRAIFLLSVPMVLEMITESVFAIVDIYFVSRIGADAVATVGITESLITIVYAVSFGLSMATTAIVSRRIGEKDKEGANHAAFQAILTGFLFSLVFVVPGIIFARDLLELMGASQKISSEYYGYTSWMLGSSTIIMLLFIINSVFRSAGDAVISMRVLWLANGLNLILDPLLIFGIGPFPELGVKGAAIATTIGRGTAVVFQFYLLLRGSKRIRLKISELKADFSIILKLLKLSVGAIFQNIIATSSWIGLVRIVSVFGSEVVAGYTIAIRIIIFSLLPSFGISNAAATLVGQNLGAKQPERAEQSVWATGKVNLLLLGFIGILFIAFPEFWVSLFASEPEVLKSGARALEIISYGFLAYGPGMVLIHSFNGAGDTMTPTKINVLAFWIIEIPLAYMLAISLDVQQNGVFYAIVIAESIMTITAALLFKKGKWKHKNV